MKAPPQMTEKRDFSVMRQISENWNKQFLFRICLVAGCLLVFWVFFNNTLKS